MFDFIFLCLLCAAVLFILSYWVVYYCYTLLYRNTLTLYCAFVTLNKRITYLLTYNANWLLFKYIFTDADIMASFPGQTRKDGIRDVNILYFAEARELDYLKINCSSFKADNHSSMTACHCLIFKGRMQLFLVPNKQYQGTKCKRTGTAMLFFSEFHVIIIYL